MIIGFAGKAATGKTTAAHCMPELLEGDVIIIPMAMVLRDEVEAFLRAIGAEADVPLIYGSQEDKVKVFHVDETQAMDACPRWSDYLEKHAEIQDQPGRSSVTTRRILQWWGTEYRRAQDPDYWTKAWERKVRSLDLDSIHVMIDDVRFMNELDVIRGLGGLIVRIIRPGFDGANNHASENALDDFDDWDGSILNDGTLEEFKKKVSVFAAGLSRS